jgi:hypothetical protein
VSRILQALAPHAVSEENLYLHFSRLSQWQLMDLSKFFGTDDYWKLFCSVRRRLGCTRVARGSFRAGVLAGPVYRLLGKKDFGTLGNYLTDPMPPVGTRIGGELAWRQHEGGHTSGPNWPAFFEWVGQYIKAPPLPPSVAPPPTGDPSARTKPRTQ